MEQHACIPSAPASGSGRHCATYGNWKFQPFAPRAVRLGGEITVDSTEGKGTTVSITLPLTPPERPVEA